MSYINGNANPKYDTQEEVYDFIFSELKACAAQLDKGTDLISGDVTSLGGGCSSMEEVCQHSSATLCDAYIRCRS